MKEELKQIEGYPNYLVSNMGYIYSNISHKKLKPYIDKDGYCIVGLFNNGRQKKLKVHRLVAKAFLENPNNYPEVNHKDENPSNNMVNNLEWCTTKYNINYGNRNKKTADKIRKNNNKYRRKVVCMDMEYNVVKIFNSLRSVDDYGFNHGRVYMVCNKIKNSFSHKGYRWMYYDEYLKQIGGTL